MVRRWFSEFFSSMKPNPEVDPNPKGYRQVKTWSPTWMDGWMEY
jgi:hypothetical protein